jgi:hypothetical protein
LTAKKFEKFFLWANKKSDFEGFSGVASESELESPKKYKKNTPKKSFLNKNARAKTRARNRPT